MGGGRGRAGPVGHVYIGSDVSLDLLTGGSWDCGMFDC